MRRILISWAAAWPTITALLLLTQGVIGHWPLALRTFVLSGIMVTLMTLLLIPAMSRFICRLKERIFP
ncbi:MAG: hypothetical protein AAF231_12945 [Pseudomonadota bacterium]